MVPSEVASGDSTFQVDSVQEIHQIIGILHVEVDGFVALGSPVNTSNTVQDSSASFLRSYRSGTISEF
ncbi:hypothetical protein [Mesorhizobium sp. M0488]|uniref:hypothetical protein n=1 Tax=unclassified Mesorhizobium TaxID=325217 RepID=UPI0033352D42